MEAQISNLSPKLSSLTHRNQNHSRLTHNTPNHSLDHSLLPALKSPKILAESNSNPQTNQPLFTLLELDQLLEFSFCFCYYGLRVCDWRVCLHSSSSGVLQLLLELVTGK
jgi:hypothetical protein